MMPNVPLHTPIESQWLPLHTSNTNSSLHLLEQEEAEYNSRLRAISTISAPDPIGVNLPPPTSMTSTGNLNTSSRFSHHGSPFDSHRASSSYTPTPTASTPHSHHHSHHHRHHDETAMNHHVAPTPISSRPSTTHSTSTRTVSSSVAAVNGDATAGVPHPRHSRSASRRSGAGRIRTARSSSSGIRRLRSDEEEDEDDEEEEGEMSFENEEDEDGGGHLMRNHSASSMGYV